ncbi:phosphotransferase family protein [Ilumatobacter sp.]|uniref:phosphotransferase family protein n=1 Tax=Ilumatobacter sp. TaxID=1967498 RepID=UPI003C64EBA6
MTGAAEHDRFVGVLSATLGGARVDDLTRLSGGASRETWRFVADGRPLVVQRQRAGDIRDMMVEARVVAAAARAEVPVPTLVASEHNEDGSAFMIVEAIEGETIARKIQRNDEFEHARTLLPEQFGAALAAIHTIEPEPGMETVDQIAHYTEAIDGFVEAGTGRPQPMLELVRRWLIDHRPPTVDPVVVHGDFRLGNLIVDENGLSAVIDWELAHLGDPMEDLGWLCVKAWRFGQAPPVAGLGDYERLFEAYEAAGGHPVDPIVVRWWEVMGTWKWAIMCTLQASVHLSGAARSHELAAIGRRVCESEHDLFLALEGRW